LRRRHAAPVGELEPNARRVALRIRKPGMVAQQVIARCEAERQALALSQAER
jgi:hypothetical protein